MSGLEFNVLRISDASVVVSCGLSALLANSSSTPGYAALTTKRKPRNEKNTITSH